MSADEHRQRELPNKPTGRTSRSTIAARRCSSCSRSSPSRHSRPTASTLCCYDAATPHA